MSDNLTDTLLQQQANAVESIACYGLPYGFASHILTYYTMITLICGRKPLLPCLRLSYRKLSLFLGCVQLILTIVTTSITIHSCREKWFLVILATRMLTTSIAMSLLTVFMPFFHKPRRGKLLRVGEGIELNENVGFGYHLPAAMTSPSPETTKLGTVIRRAILLLVLIAILWFLGCAAGVVAILFVTGPRYNYEINNGTTGPMYIVTLVFAGLCFLPLVLLGLRGCLREEWCTGREFCGALILTPLFISAFALLWMDRGLAIVTGNLVGSPPRGTLEGIFWTYITAKRLPMLSF